MITKTSRFGEVGYDEDDCVQIVGGMLGFPGCERFVLVQHRDGSPFRWLQSLDEPALAFLVVSPSDVTADYNPTVPEDEAHQIDLSAEDPVLVYAVVTIPPGKPQEMTVNLAGPIIINPRNRRARQVVVEDVCYGTKHAVVAGADEPVESVA